jgi:hypothetical protein
VATIPDESGLVVKPWRGRAYREPRRLLHTVGGEFGSVAILARVDRVRMAREKDPAAEPDAEVILYENVLAAIAFGGCKDPQACAAAALTIQHLDATEENATVGELKQQTDCLQDIQRRSAPPVTW